jgi:hypothetical protein
MAPVQSMVQSMFGLPALMSIRAHGLGFAHDWGSPPYNRTGELHPVAVGSCSILKFSAYRRPSHRLPVGVADDEASSVSSAVHGGGKRRRFGVSVMPPTVPSCRGH